MELPQKINSGSALWPNDSTYGNIFEETQNTNLKEYMHSYVYCSVIYNSQDLEAAQVLPVDEWIKKLQYIYTMEYYSSIKMKEILPFATAWMDL